MAKIRKRKKPLNVIAKIGIFVFIAITCVRLISLQASIAAKKRELAAIEQKVEQQTNDNKEIQEALDAGLEDDYIIKIARERLGYILPNERVYVDITQE